MISVIVPVYNVEKYLNNCVESIVNQTYKDLEIILVDDGSPDNCPAMCDEWAKKDSRIRVIHKENGGLSSARNAGLEAANGDYIAFVDSDDSIDLFTYDSMMKSIMESKADLSLCKCQFVKTKSDIIVYNGISSYTVLNNDELWEEVFGRLNNSACNKIYKLDLINKLRFDENLLHGEDLIFNIQYINNCKIGAIVEGRFYHYYSREGSITKSVFNSNKYKEILSKDTAKQLVEKLNPKYMDVANRYCFRSRLNVLRSIYLSKTQNDNNDIVRECKEYLKANYHKVKCNLRKTDFIEYILVSYFKNVYILYLNFIKILKGKSVK